jgi:hypothetical protein
MRLQVRSPIHNVAGTANNARNILMQIVTDPRHLLPNFIDFIHGAPKVRVQRAVMSSP